MENQNPITGSKGHPAEKKQPKDKQPVNRNNDQKAPSYQLGLTKISSSKEQRKKNNHKGANTIGEMFHPRNSNFLSFLDDPPRTYS